MILNDATCSEISKTFELARTMSWKTVNIMQTNSNYANALILI